MATRAPFSADAERLTAVGLVGAVNYVLVDWLMAGQRDLPVMLAEVCSTLFSSAVLSPKVSS